MRNPLCPALCPAVGEVRHLALGQVILWAADHTAALDSANFPRFSQSIRAAAPERRLEIVSKRVVP